jgi:di/tricarboxylate transporter
MTFSEQTQGRKSLVRVKVAFLFVTFLGCWILLKYFDSRRYESTLFAIAGVSATLFYFVRCEQCKSSIYYSAGGKRSLLLLGAPGFLMAKKCPICGKLRV